MESKVNRVNKEKLDPRDLQVLMDLLVKMERMVLKVNLEPRVYPAQKGSAVRCLLKTGKSASGIT